MLLSGQKTEDLTMFTFEVVETTEQESILQLLCTIEKSVDWV